ncbi:MAG: FMN-binding negative transcriptional regulator [Pseudomonadota bacterium]
MYQPEPFAESDLSKLHGLIRAHPLATLVTLNEGGLQASHVPMVLAAEEGPAGTLRGHLARPNPQWRSPASELEALCIFSGPDAYISPSWYETKKETAKVVPTWNYVTVHAYGPLTVTQDRDWLLQNVSELTDQQERDRPERWQVSDAPERFTETMLRGIVGIEIPITRIEGKWKASQNRPEADRDGVVRGLNAGTPAEAAMAELVRERS